MANNELPTSANVQVSITSEDYKEVVQRLVKAEHTIETKDAELAKVKAEIETLKLSADNAKSAFTKGSEALASVLDDAAVNKISQAGAENFFKVLVDEVGNKLSQDDKISAQLEEVKAKLAELENEKRLASRSSRIRDSLNLTTDDNDRLDKLVASTDGLNDESFDSWLENTMELFVLAQKDSKKEEKEEDKKDKKDKKNPFTKSSDEDGVTDTRILDNVVAGASAPAGVDDAVQPVSLPEKMQTLASALWGANKRDNSEGGK